MKADLFMIWLPLLSTIISLKFSKSYKIAFRGSTDHKWPNKKMMF